MKKCGEMVAVSINYLFIVLTLVAYFAMNVLFAVRLRYVLADMGYKVSLSQTLWAQYGGMLASDFTPARAGYLVAAALLNPTVPISAGSSAILSIQSIEFFVKAAGAVLGILFFISFFKNLLPLAVLGVAVMVLGAVSIVLILRMGRIPNLLGKIPFMKRFLSKLLEAQTSAKQLGRKIIVELVAFTLILWVVKGFEWYFIGLSVGINQISWLGFFLLHPLVTAMSFVPLMPSGFGFQEGASVGLLYLLDVPLDEAVTFTFLARFLLILQDLIGLYPLSKTGFHVIKDLMKR